MKVLVLGGTGVISRSIVSQLLEKNHEVTTFNRGKKSLDFKGHVEQLVGDRSNREEFEASMGKHKFDVVIDMICFNAEDAKSTLRAFRGRVEQLVICSSVAAYKRPYNSLPVSEDGEELFDNPAFGYAFNKAEMERYINREAIQEKLNVTIVRPSLTYGVGAANIGVLRQNYGIVDRIRKGKPLIMFGDGTTPWSFTFVPDLAKGFVGVVGNKKTYGQCYHITNEDRHIWEDLYLEFGKLVGREPDIRHISSELLCKAAPNLFNHLYYEKSYAGIFDNTKIKRDVPGFNAGITLGEGLKTILEWFEKEADKVDPEKDELEDRLVAAYDKWVGDISGMYMK